MTIFYENYIRTATIAIPLVVLILGVYYTVKRRKNSKSVILPISLTVLTEFFLLFNIVGALTFDKDGFACIGLVYFQYVFLSIITPWVVSLVAIFKLTKYIKHNSPKTRIALSSIVSILFVALSIAITYIMITVFRMDTSITDIF